MSAVKISFLYKRENFSPTVTSFLLQNKALSPVIRWLFSPLWHSVFTYARNDTWAFNIQLSQQTSSIRTSNAGKNKGSEALKRQRLMISFFKWHSSVLCYWTLIWNHHFSSIKTALISQTALSKCLGKHLKFWSMTFQLRKQSPSSFLLRALHAPGNGRAKIPGWFPRPLGLNIPCLKSLPNLYTSYD